MIDELIELAAELASLTRAYLYAQERGYDAAAIRLRIEEVLDEFSLRNL